LREKRRNSLGCHHSSWHRVSPAMFIAKEEGSADSLVRINKEIRVKYKLARKVDFFLKWIFLCGEFMSHKLKGIIFPGEKRRG
jgi:hypothetical protein